MPPKGAAVERAEDNVPPEAPAASTPEQAESIDERHARLTLAVRSQRMLVEIEEAERELREGSTPASGARGAGELAGGVSQEWARGAMPPPLFRRVSLCELQDFQQGCEVSSTRSTSNQRAGESPLVRPT